MICCRYWMDSFTLVSRTVVFMVFSTAAVRLEHISVICSSVARRRVSI